VWGTIVQLAKTSGVNSGPANPICDMPTALQQVRARYRQARRSPE
jgi:hypothetical protein